MKGAQPLVSSYTADWGVEGVMALAQAAPLHHEGKVCAEVV